jgi:hypothetical protein
LHIQDIKIETLYSHAFKPTNHVLLLLRVSIDTIKNYSLSFSPENTHYTLSQYHDRLSPIQADTITDLFHEHSQEIVFIIHIYSYLMIIIGKGTQNDQIMLTTKSKKSHKKLVKLAESQEQSDLFIKLI